MVSKQSWASVFDDVSFLAYSIFNARAAVSPERSIPADEIDVAAGTPTAGFFRGRGFGAY